MLTETVKEEDWYDPKWHDDAFTALYDGIWLESIKYSEAESKLLRLGFFPGEIKEATHGPFLVKPQDYTYHTFPPTVIKTPKRGKKLSKGRQHIEDIKTSLAHEIAFARERIKNFMQSSDIHTCDFNTPGYVPALLPVPVFNMAESPSSVKLRVSKLEEEYSVVLQRLNALTEEVRHKLDDMTLQEAQKVQQKAKYKDPREKPSDEKKLADEINVHKKTLVEAAEKGFDDYDEIAMFASDEGITEKLMKEKQEQLEAEFDKRAKKPAKVQYIMDLLTDKRASNRQMMELTKVIRGIKKLGLRIRATKILPVQYGVRRLQVVCVVDEEFLTLEQAKNQLQERRDLVNEVVVIQHKTINK